MKVYINPDGSYEDEQGNPLSLAQAAAAKTAAETSPLEAALVGAGRTFSTIGENLGLMDAQPGSITAMEALRNQHPLSTMAGEAAPLLAPVPGGALAQMAAGGALGALSTNQAEGDQLTAGALGTIGGGLGHMAGRVLDRIFKFKPDTLVGGGQAARTAERLGDPAVTPGERTGWGWLKGTEAGIQGLPGGSSAYNLKGRQAIVNQKALDVFNLGGAHKTISDDAIDDIMDVIDTDFRAVEAAIPDVTLPAWLADDVRNVGGITGAFKNTVGSKPGVALGEAGEEMTLTGNAAMKIRSRMLRKNKNPNDLSVERGEAIDALDNFIEQSVPDGVMQDWAAARGKDRFSKGLEKANVDGDVSAAKLRTQLRDWSDATGSVKDARDLTRALNSPDFKRPFGRPGTAETLMNAAGLGGGGAIGFGLGGVPGAIAGAVAAPVVGYGTGALERGLLSAGSALSRSGAGAGRTGALFAPDYLALEE
mgnify:CR=1 FL=1